ncbi:MAG TPA: carboxypeptidase-like regulatory domain-containing protein [Azoarcus taiwanensis]|nr:carboxypeptidase-like regulatory domain-containing protein [Azoarcus taiwanensis]
MIVWLEIGDADGVARAYYRADSSRPHITAPIAIQALVDVSAIRRPLSIPGVDAVRSVAASMTVTLDNADGRITSIMGPRPPVRELARIMSPAGEVFRGLITDIDLGESVSIDIQAGLDRPLTDALPLRKSTVWGGYRDVRTLPWGYGFVTVTPIQYSDDQRGFLLLDHPIAGVDRVTRDNVPTDAYEWFNDVDSTGHACAFIELAEPLSEGEALAVSLRGRMHPATGRLLTTPAEIVHDVLAHLAGASIGWPEFDGYRTETAEISIGGVIDDGEASIRATIDRIVQSAGGAWSAGMPGVAFTWPPVPDPVAPAFPVSPLTAADIRATCAHDGIVTVLRVLFDYDNAAGRHRRAIELRAPGAVKDYGVLDLEWDAGWLRSPRDAEALGRRMLAWLARPRWRVSWSRDYADIRPGAWADIAHPRAPIVGRHRLLDAELDLASPELRCVVEAPVGAAPEIAMTRLSTAFEPVIPAGVTIEIGDNEIIYTVRGDDGEVLAGAAVTLNGAVTRITGSDGKVSFAPLERGRQHLLIETPGRPAAEVWVVV